MKSDHKTAPAAETVNDRRQRPAELRPDPLRFLQNRYQDELALCDELEAIADSLPHAVNKLDCLDAVNRIRTCGRVHSEYDTKCLFPLLRKRAGVSAGLFSKLDRLEHQHMDDEDWASEIADTLESLVAGSHRLEPETIAYMLRGYFQGLRRHIAFEQDIVLPIASATLNGTDLKLLEDRIAEVMRDCDEVAMEIGSSTESAHGACRQAR